MMKKIFRLFLLLVFLFCLAFLQLSAEGDIPLELEVEEGDLVMYYVDGENNYVFEPMVVSFNPIDTSFEFGEAEGVLGTPAQKLRIDNASSGEVELSVALYVTTFEEDAKWIDGEESFLAYSTDGIEGGLLVDPSEINIDDDDCGVVTNNVVIPNRFTYIDGENPETNITSIDVLSTTGADNCRFDVTNIFLTQTIPPRTPAGNYTLGMVLTLTGGEWWAGEWSCGQGFVDTRDGDKEYTTVEIGGQCWMAENLDYDNGCSSVTWENSVDKGWCGYHENDTGETHGLLYQWSAAMAEDTVEEEDSTTSVQGICPEGWLLPSDSEWHTLETDFADPENDCSSTRLAWQCAPAGDQLKSLSADWCEGSPCGESGFEALPLGFRFETDGSYIGNDSSYWWTTRNVTYVAINRTIASSLSSISRGTHHQANANSVRCLKD